MVDITPPALELEVTPAAQRGPGHFVHNPRHLAAWVEDLPLANEPETCRLVLNALTELNRSALSAAQRHHALETLRPTIDYLTRALSPIYLRASLPLPVRAVKAAEMVQTLQRALSTGYKIVVLEAVETGSRVPNGVLVSALQRALRHCGDVLLSVYQVYGAPPARLWRNIHQLFGYAEARGAHRTGVDDAYAGKHYRTTIEADYKRVLLMAVANPYRFTPRQLGSIYNHGLRWAALCHLTPPTAAGVVGTFTVHLDSDAPPQPPATDPLATTAQTRLLDTAELIYHLRRELRAGFDPAARKTQPPRHLLRRLLAVWAANPKRQFSRLRATQDITLAAGLSSIHHRLANANTRGLGGAPWQAPARFHSHALQQAADSVNDQDVWAMIYPQKQPQAQDAPATTPEPSLRYATYRCRVVNESASGACLLWQDATAACLGVGELVALRRGQAPWALGVVRWVRQNNRATGIQFGIEYLAPGARAVGIRREGDQRQGRLRSLLLLGVRAVGYPPTLLVPVTQLQVGDTVVLTYGQCERRLRLTAVMEQTETFTRFRFHKLPPQTETAVGLGQPMERPTIE